MAIFILVPGAMHGSWCWERVTRLLEAAGHRAISIDLPGMGANHAIATDEVTLADWADHVAAVIAAQSAPVILAGHSRGGLVIGEAAEREPARVAGLIYVTALLVPPGRSINQLRGITAGEGVPVTLDDATITALFYQRCTAQDAAWAIARLEPEPLQLLSSPATITAENWGRVPRGYIECSDDATLPLDFQRRMQATLPCDPVMTLDSDHSPWLCAPQALAKAMLAMVRKFGI